MVELTLDGSTIAQWTSQFIVLLGLFGIAVLALGVALIVTRGNKRTRWLALIPAIVTGVALLNTRLSPYAYYRRTIAPSLARGDKLYQKYEDYKKVHGTYPASIQEVYFPELDYFDTVVGVRTSPKCDGFGQGCLGVGMNAGQSPGQTGQPGSTEGLVVNIYHELIRCELAGPEGHWTCRDMR